MATQTDQAFDWSALTEPTVTSRAVKVRENAQIDVPSTIVGYVEDAVAAGPQKEFTFEFPTPEIASEATMYFKAAGAQRTPRVTVYGGNTTKDADGNSVETNVVSFHVVKYSPRGGGVKKDTADTSAE